MIRKLIYIFIGIGLFFGIFWLLSQPPKTQSGNTSTTKSAEASEKDTYKDSPVYDNPDLVFYWGNGCPHCENVEKWLNENNKDKKIKVNYKEVYYNKDNQTALYNTAKQYCPEIIENGSIGVPTGFDPVTKKCIQGDTPIIDFLTSKLAK
jgi:glutaredoxin